MMKFEYNGKQYRLFFSHGGKDGHKSRFRKTTAMIVEQPDDYDSKTSPRLEILFKGESINRDTSAFPYVKETGRQIALERLYTQTGDEEFNRAIRKAYWTAKDGQRSRKRDPLAARLEESLNPERVAKMKNFKKQHRNLEAISVNSPIAKLGRHEIVNGKKRIVILFDEVV
jgi:hypothetical protein